MKIDYIMWILIKNIFFKKKIRSKSISDIYVQKAFHNSSIPGQKQTKLLAFFQAFEL